MRRHKEKDAATYRERWKTNKDAKMPEKHEDNINILAYNNIKGVITISTRVLNAVVPIIGDSRKGKET